MKRILILGAYDFPHGDAPSNRLLALAKTLREAGYRPFVLGHGREVRAYRDRRTGTHVVEGIEFGVLRPSAGRLRSRLLRTWRLAGEVRRAGITDVRCIYITQGTLTLGFALLCRYAWRRPLIVDCAEWFEPFQFPRGRLSPAFARFIVKFHALRGPRANIVAITGTLAAEFARRGCHVTCLPPQVDTDTFVRHHEIGRPDRIELFYAGTPGRKDHVGTALAGLLALPPEQRSRVHFTIAGAGPEELAATVPGGVDALRALGGSVTILGRVPRDEVLRHLAAAHFSVLLRPVSRYSTAGFPSKIPESLAAGTPPMLTLTSDLGSYLSDGEDCLVVDECSPQAFAKAVRRALELPAAELAQLSRQARQCARRYFDYRSWVAPLRAFVEDCD